MECKSDEIVLVSFVKIHQTSCKESVVSSLFNRTYSIVTIKGGLIQGNKGIKC